MGLGEYDQTYFVQFDVDNAIYVYGQTESDWTITPGCFGSPSSGQFIRKYDSNLNNIEWTTTIGAASGHVEISPTAFWFPIVMIYTWQDGEYIDSNGAASFYNKWFPNNSRCPSNQTNGSNLYCSS